MPAIDALAPEGSLFRELRGACAAEWESYVGHDFVRRLGAGTLPQACFRHYLGQDYLFLIHFARAYALAVYKSETLADMRAAARTVSALLDTEMSLHVRFCAGWGMSEAEMQALPEHPATMAYTRYVLERGLAGDLLDLQVALAPCVVGYAEIGLRLMLDSGTLHESNPYEDWIEQYSSDDYVEVARGAVAQLDRSMAARGSAARMPGLIETFRQATRLEAAFWDMGLAAPE